MKKIRLVLSSLIIVCVMMLISALYVSANPAQVDVRQSDQTGASDEGVPVGEAPTGGDEISPPVEVGTTLQAANAEPTRLVYFAAQDNDANGTVIVLYNTTTVTHTVTVTGYSPAGNAFWNVDVGPNRVMHLVSDSLAAASPPSWANSVVTNFTDFTTYVSVAVPEGIKVDGYIIFNPTTGTVDPRADQGAIVLRLSIDPLTVFMPGVNHSP